MPRLRLGKCAGVRPHDEGLHREPRAVRAVLPLQRHDRPFPLGGAAESGFPAPGGPGDGRKNALRRRILRRPGGRIGIVNTIRSRKMQKIYKKGLANFTEI